MRARSLFHHPDSLRAFIAFEEQRPPVESVDIGVASRNIAGVAMRQARSRVLRCLGLEMGDRNVTPISAPDLPL